MLLETQQIRAEPFRCHSYESEQSQIGGYDYLGTVIRTLKTDLREITPARHQHNGSQRLQEKVVSPTHSQSLERTVKFTPRFNNPQNQCLWIQATHSKTCNMLTNTNKSSEKGYGNTQKCTAYKNIKVQQRKKQQKETRFHTSYPLREEEDKESKLVKTRLSDCNESEIDFNENQMTANENSSKQSVSIILQFLDFDRELQEMSEMQAKNGVQLFYEQIIGKQMKTVESLQSLPAFSADSLNYSNDQSFQFSFLAE